jgi:hypothetical protein
MNLILFDSTFEHKDIIKNNVMDNVTIISVNDTINVNDLPIYERIAIIQNISTSIKLGPYNLHLSDTNLEDNNLVILLRKLCVKTKEIDIISSYMTSMWKNMTDDLENMLGITINTASNGICKGSWTLNNHHEINVKDHYFKDTINDDTNKFILHKNFCNYTDAKTLSSGEYVLGSTTPGFWGVGGGATVTYSFADADGYSTNERDAGGTIVSIDTFMPVGAKAEIVRAFDSWTAVTNIIFTELTDNDAAFDASGAGGDIRIGGHIFDGNGGTLAHAFYPPSNGYTSAGDIHFDVAETWVIGFNKVGFDIFQVASHEIGHAIGLAHTSVTGSLMNAFYSESFSGPQADDIAGIQSLYGEPICLRSDTTVYANGEWKKITELKPGDVLKGFDGECELIDVICVTGCIKFVKIEKNTFGDHNTLYITHGHPLYINGEEIISGKLVNDKTVTIEHLNSSEDVYSLITKDRVPVCMANGLYVYTWAEVSWAQSIDTIKSFERYKSSTIFNKVRHFPNFTIQKSDTGVNNKLIMFKKGSLGNNNPENDVILSTSDFIVHGDEKYSAQLFVNTFNIKYID